MARSFNVPVVVNLLNDRESIFESGIFSFVYQ